VSVALVIQHVKRMRSIILSSVASPTLPYFSTLPHTLHDFSKKKITEHKMSVSTFSALFCPKHFSFKEEFGDILS